MGGDMTFVSTDLPASDSADDPAPTSGEPGPATTSRTVRIISLAVGLVVFGLVILLAVGGGDVGPERSAVLGQRVPRVAGMPIEGLAGYSVGADGTARPYDIDEHRGEWVLINFFATWCPGCIVEHPELVALEQWGLSSNLTLVAVVFDDPNTSAIQDFFAKEGGNWPVIQSANTAVDFQIAQIPESFLVAPNGQVIEHFIGGLKANDVKTTIGELTP